MPKRLQLWFKMPAVLPALPNGLQDIRRLGPQWLRSCRDVFTSTSDAIDKNETTTHNEAKIKRFWNRIRYGGVGNKTVAAGLSCKAGKPSLLGLLTLREKSSV